MTYSMTIVITGPESSGKTTLIADLARYLGVVFVDEYARDYLQAKNGTYEYDDLLEIARGHYNMILDAKDNFSPILIDTDLLTIKIWSEYKYGKCDQWITDTLENNRPDLYLLCKPDIPWVEDPLRENPYNREELFQIYKSEIKKLDVSSIEIAGCKEDRLSIAINAIQELINED